MGSTRRLSSISVAMPVHNERRTIREIIRRIKAVQREKEIIIVDDFSNDGTRRILNEYRCDPEIRIVLQPENRGKGAALHAAFALATKDVVIVQDADLEYSPQDYEMLLRPIDAGLADVVYGSRFLHGERRVLYFRHTLGNRLLTLLSNLFTDLNLTDMETCYKAFKREIIQNIELVSPRFGFEPEITAKISKLPCTVYEVPINYYGRSYEQGKKITWKDGVAALRHIAVFSLSRKPFVKDRAALERALVNPPEPPDTGVLTLEVFEKAIRYNRWIFGRLRQHVGPRVLEVGAGIGNIIAELVNDPKVEQIVATDHAPGSLSIIRDRFSTDTFLDTVVWDANQPIPSVLSGQTFDTVICTNVLEHVEHDDQALRSMKRLLKPDGKLLLLVPAHPALFCTMDQELGHFRRYRRGELRSLLAETGFEVEDILDHNFFGAIGWFIAGKVLGRKQLSNGDIRRFDRLVPILRRLDLSLAPLFGGVSLIAICRCSPKPS
ncbi:MAG: glycosyltransferase [Acidobacteriota bacterium]